MASLKTSPEANSDRQKDTMTEKATYRGSSYCSAQNLCMNTSLVVKGVLAHCQYLIISKQIQFLTENFLIQVIASIFRKLSVYVCNSSRNPNSSQNETPCTVPANSWEKSPLPPDFLKLNLQAW